MANHSGTSIRVILNDSADEARISIKLEEILKKQNRKPKKLDKESVESEIANNQWRATDSVGEFSEIEIRTVFARRVKIFVEKNELGEVAAKSLFAMSERALSETPASTRDTDFRVFRSGLKSRFLELAKDILDAGQLEKLSKLLESRVIG